MNWSWVPSLDFLEHLFCVALAVQSSLGVGLHDHAILTDHSGGTAGHLPVLAVDAVGGGDGGVLIGDQREADRVLIRECLLVF